MGAADEMPRCGDPECDRLCATCAPDEVWPVIKPRPPLTEEQWVRAWAKNEQFFRGEMGAVWRLPWWRRALYWLRSHLALWRKPAHITEKVDSEGNVVAVALGDQPISAEQLEADIRRMEKFAVENPPTSLDDVVYRSRDDS